MSTTFELRKQVITHYEGGEPVFTEPEVLEESSNYKSLSSRKAVLREQAIKEGLADSVVLWITPQARKVNA